MKAPPPGGATRCLFCGYRITTPADPDAATPPEGVAAAPSTDVCGHCGRPLKGRARCLFCGTTPGGAPPKTGPKAPEPPPVLRKVSCPSCGSGIDLRAKATRFVVCASCGSDVDLREQAPSLLRKASRWTEPGTGGLRVGLQGMVHGKECVIVGRLRYDAKGGGERWHWIEWLLAFTDGSTAWLQDEDGVFVLFRPFVPSEPPETSRLAEGRSVRLEGAGTGSAVVREVAQARITRWDGEIPWVPDPEEPVSYADLEAGPISYSVEWTAEEVEFYRGTRMPGTTVMHAFGLDPSAMFGRGGGGGDDDDDDDGDGPQIPPAVIVGVIAVFLVGWYALGGTTQGLFLLLAALADDNGGGHGGFGGGK